MGKVKRGFCCLKRLEGGALTHQRGTATAEKEKRKREYDRGSTCFNGVLWGLERIKSKRDRGRKIKKKKAERDSNQSKGRVKKGKRCKRQTYRKGSRKVMIRKSGGRGSGF